MTETLSDQDAVEKLEEPPKQLSDDQKAVYQLAYSESQRNLTQQAGVLDNIRTRAGLVIAAANVVTAFLGAPALKIATTPLDTAKIAPGLTYGGWLAMASFAVVGISCVLILWPWSWKFRFSPTKIINRIDAEPDETLPSIHRQLANLNERNFKANETKIGRLFKLFEVAIVALFLEAIFWLASLAGVNIGGVLL